MGRKWWTRTLAMIVGAIIGAGIGYLVGQSALGAVVGAGIGAWVVLGLIAGLIALVSAELRGALRTNPIGALFEGLDLVASGCECCSSFFVLSGACIVTLGGLLLWHNLALAALAGVGVMTVLFAVLSTVARSYKDASAVQ